MKRSLYMSMICLVSCLVLAGCSGSAPAPEADAAEQETADHEESAPEEQPDSSIKSKKKSLKEMAGSRSEKGETYYEDIYAPILDEVKDVVDNGFDPDGDYKYIPDGIMERAMYSQDGELKGSIGYYLKDMNGDGVTELLIGENAEYEYDTPNEVSFIYCGYTCKDNKPECFVEGWARSRQHYMGDGHFFHTGSGGAMNTCFGEWHLDEKSGEVVWDDYYFSTEDMINGGIAFFHNTTGEDDTDGSERLKISEDEFDEILGRYDLKIDAVAWIPIGTRETGGRYIVNTMTDDELLDIENKLNEVGYYGFLCCTYRDPRDINWDQVFYVGAGFDKGMPSPKIRKEYLKATGASEIITDITSVSGEDVRNYVKETTGYDYSEMNHPLDWVYLEDQDMYMFEHGDTNQISIQVTGAMRDRDEYIVTYYGYDEPEGCVIFREVDGKYRFISNLPRWMVEDPTNGGDVDQSMITQGMILPDSDSRKLTEDDLKGLDADELRIARNEIYARHGRIFTDKKLREHFESMEWYFPTTEPADFDESILSETERYNLDLITKYEKKKQ